MKLGQGWCLYSRFVEELSAFDLLILPQNLADTCINRRELFKGSVHNSRSAVCVPWLILSI